MNLYEFVMMVFYVGFCTGILSLGVHFTEKARAREYIAKNAIEHVEHVDHVDHVSTQA